MFGKQQFVGKVEGSVTDKYDILKVSIISYKKYQLLILNKNYYIYL